MTKDMQAKHTPGDKITSLQVTYTIPDGMSDDDAIKLICKHLGAMNDLHRSLGGSGLKVLSCKVEDSLD
jgi:hypothetical protein